MRSCNTPHKHGSTLCVFNCWWPPSPHQHTIATGPVGGDVAGLAVSADGRRLAYTTCTKSHSTTTLEIRGAFGRRVSANLARYEARVNPDRNTAYEVPNASDCVKRALDEDASYRGKVDSHPYAVASAGQHWFVADAGGNDILRVSGTGVISTVARAASAAA